jgi:uncharacterized membrane protein HdeD (DUF308 family)
MKNHIDKLIKAAKWSMLVSGLLVLALGIWMLFTPLESIMGLAIFISIVMLISGISEIASYFMAEKKDRVKWKLAGGFISAFFGIWIMFGSGLAAVVTIIPFVFAAWMITVGLVHVLGTFSLEHKGIGRTILLLFAFAETAFGLLLMYSPWFSMTVISAIMGVMYISHAATNISNFVYLHKIEKSKSKPQKTEGV